MLKVDIHHKCPLFALQNLRCVAKPVQVMLLSSSLLLSLLLSLRVSLLFCSSRLEHRLLFCDFSFCHTPFQRSIGFYFSNEIKLFVTRQESIQFCSWFTYYNYQLFKTVFQIEKRILSHVKQQKSKQESCDTALTEFSKP